MSPVVLVPGYVAVGCYRVQQTNDSTQVSFLSIQGLGVLCSKTGIDLGFSHMSIVHAKLVGENYSAKTPIVELSVGAAADSAAHSASLSSLN